MTDECTQYECKGCGCLVFSLDPKYPTLDECPVCGKILDVGDIEQIGFKLTVKNKES